ncbi:MAG: ATPase [Paludibacteraceae bacterium]|nr:ATPase [Paludibacteraceae bacterium]
MILIADSGSTKTHWCLIANNGDANEFFTDGINPFFQTSEAMQNSVSNQLLPQMGHLMWVGPVTNVFFYGAGCTPEKIPFVARALQAVFKKAQVEVNSDMLGAARALLGDKAGVACILGTGSNSCQYDGEKFVKNVPALGFILGDEGSGAVLGKRLVADLLKNQLSDELKEKFLTQYNTSQADIIENVYRKPFPNRFLAKLSKFAAENIDNPMIYNLVYDHFNQFVIRNLKQYPQELPVGFVGSIAYYYKDVLEKVLNDNGIQLANILQDPVEGLKQYHKKDLIPA